MNSKRYLLVIMVVMLLLFGCTKSIEYENISYNSISEIESLLSDETLFATLAKKNYFFLFSYRPFNGSYSFNIVVAEKKSDDKIQIISDDHFTFALDDQDRFIEPKKLTVSTNLDGLTASFRFVDTNSSNAFPVEQEDMIPIPGLSGVYYSYTFQ